MNIAIDHLTRSQQRELWAIAEKMDNSNRAQCDVASEPGRAVNQACDGAEQTKAADPRVAQGGLGSFGHRSEEVTLDNVDEVMRYQPWSPDQVNAGDIVRETLTAAVRAILRVVPRCPNRTKAINHLIDARMDANAAISFRGRF